jgi:linoleate 10R-lipoxygenase
VKASTPRGVGNQVSVEFNLAYRWHSCIGEVDEKWTEKIYHELFGKGAADVSMTELMIGLKKYDEHMPKDPMQRPFAHLKRGEDGKFADEDLVNIMQTGIEEMAGTFATAFVALINAIPAAPGFFPPRLSPNLQLTTNLTGAFGARNVPKCLRAISILGMKQARAWNCGSLNEFRKFFGLKTYDTFEEINPDPYVAEQLKHLYGRTNTVHRKGESF